MRNGLKGMVIIMALGFLASFLSACGSGGISDARGTTALSKEDVLTSLKEDFGINVETEFAEFKVTHTNDLKSLYHNEITEKLALSGDFRDGLNVLYIKTDEGKHKFVYYTPRLRNRGGMTFSAKDGIYITDYPLQYTIDDIFEKTELIADALIKDRVSENFYENFSGFASFYSIVKNQRIRYVFDDTYFFVFGSDSKTYMVMFQDELYIIENQRCIYPRNMSIAEMVIQFSNN